MHRHSSKARGIAGFTLIEILVVMAIMTVIIIAALSLLDSTNDVASRQIAQVEMQQSLRVAQSDMVHRIRHLGRGGLPAGSADAGLPSPGLAIAMRDNVPASTKIVTGEAEEALANTDVLIVRGVFESPAYQVNYPDETTFTIDDETEGKGTLIVKNESPVGQIPQPFDVFQRAIDDNIREAVLLASPTDDSVWGVVEFDPGASSIDTGTPKTLTLKFRYKNGSDGTSHADAYAKLSSGPAATPGGPPTFPLDKFKSTRVGALGILEEYRYYVRDVKENTVPVPKLSRARVFPGTETPYKDDAAYIKVDIADYVFDLQVAIGVDDAPTDGIITESADGSNDEWFGNNSGDLDASGTALPPLDDALTKDAPEVYFIRITTLGRAPAPIRNYLARAIDEIEDRDYASDTLNNVDERRYVRTLLKTTVDMRNL